MKYVIFDIDGTLCHSEIDNKSFIEAFKKEFDIEIQNRTWDTYPHVTDYFITEMIVSEKFNDKATSEQITGLINRYVNELDYHMSKNPGCIKIIPGANDVFDLLKCNPDYKIAIATGGFSKSANYKLDKLGFNTAGIKVFSSDNFRTKNDMILNLIETEKDINFDKIFYVGDREYDYTVTKDLGIDFIGIDFGRNDSLINKGIKYVINDFLPIEKFTELL